MQIRTFAPLLLALTLWQSPASAASCPEHFADGKAPTVTSATYAHRLTDLCFKGYAVLYSGEARAPLWSAEYLTTNKIKEAKKLKRQDKFHEEMALPNADRAYLTDFKGSSKLSFDRGHLSPNSDFDTYESQFEAFSLSNIVVQSSDNNQHLWVGLETVARKLATQRQRIYVITGPIFEGDVKKLNDRIMIPSRLYKAIYDPVRKEAGAYIALNKEGDYYEVVSISKLESIIGINLFPAMPTSIKNNAMRLPEPDLSKIHFKNNRPSKHGSDNSANTGSQARTEEQTDKERLLSVLNEGRAFLNKWIK